MNFAKHILSISAAGITGSLLGSIAGGSIMYHLSKSSISHYSEPQSSVVKINSPFGSIVVEENENHVVKPSQKQMDTAIKTGSVVGSIVWGVVWGVGTSIYLVKSKNSQAAGQLMRGALISKPYKHLLQMKPNRV